MKRMLSLFLFLIAPAAFGWTRAADFRIARNAAGLAPRDLTMMLHKFGNDYTRGVDRGLADEGTDIKVERLRQRIEEEANSIVEMLRSNAKMPAIVERLGFLAHLISDANNPFHVQKDTNLAESHSDFEKYFERRMELFPTVSYGIDRNLKLGPYLDHMLARTAKLAPLMEEEYFRGGERRTSAEFDDRSTAFGVASICYSHAVTDIGNLYTYIWRQAGGDVRPKN